ncbi:MAG: sigma-70 family RNA polymerase sigma factor [Clostridiales bacterium]|nr:sigma-70 family RNA polymerase sigma factor [Clostridiales bacterium]
MSDSSQYLGSAPVSDEQIEQLYQMYGTDVLRMSYSYLGNQQQAEDVTQDVFLRLMENRPVLKPGSEKSWLLKVALNRCRDHWRSSWHKRVLLGSKVLEIIPDDDRIEDRIEKEALMQAVNALPQAEKEVFLLFYYQGLSTQETAAVLDTPEGTVSSRLSRGRQKLKQFLDGGEEP